MIKYHFNNTAYVANAKLWEFPSGEVGAALLPVSEDFSGARNKMHITASLRNSVEFMQLVMFLDAVKSKHYNMEVTLLLPYLAYARQDRVCNEGESLSIRAIANIINSYNLHEVILVDVHSDVSLALFNNCRHITQEFTLGRFVQFEVPDALIAPDAGALKKTTALAKRFGVKQVITATKERDLATGAITHTYLNGQVEGLSVMIVDDICDGGATFVGLANCLYGVKRKSLAITHGIFTKGVKAVDSHFDAVYTTNSYSPELESNTKNLVVDRKFY